MVATTCYMINKSLTSTLMDNTPMDHVYIGKKHSLQHIHVFGCEAYAYVPKKR